MSECAFPRDNAFDRAGSQEDPPFCARDPAAGPPNHHDLHELGRRGPGRVGRRHVPKVDPRDADEPSSA